MQSVVDFDVPNLGKLQASFKQHLDFILDSAPDAQNIGILTTSVGEKGAEVFNTLSLIDESKYDVIPAFEEY
ncbi:hypothetical protein PR048_009889 [Dryococelus australis]|uniref:Uncharacterized protein n=1 Tax=Dryococelus australis TaxID=614101 RepID=A0ABQ9I169_9NEOP|nr:hypothetical protein PR048_009889 [Dryococelus australis]